MQIAYSWLKELTGLDWSAHEMGDRLRLGGLNCEDVQPTDKYLDKVVVGQVLTLDEVPGASKIRKATVDVGKEKLAVICGAPNVAVGQKVAVAQIGAKLAGGMEIKKATIRGVESSGMICSESELGISEDHAGIKVLDASAVVGRAVADELDFHDAILTIEITPNRGDALSAFGIARDLAALAKVKLRRPEIKLNEAKERAADQFTVRSDDPVGCPRFTARIIRNIKIGPSPWWLQKKLLAAGVRPISNVVDITNLVMLETGNPLHAFDLDRFGSRQVVVRRAKNGEKFTTLDGNEHTLTDDVLLVTNGERAVGAAGVMGGLDSEVGDDTKNVLLEVAYFDPTVIRKSRRHLGLNSEASYRFERGVDPNNVERASARAAALMAELCRGEVQAGVVDWYPTPIQPKKVKLRPGRCQSVLGADIPVETMREILMYLEIPVEGVDPLTVTVPTFRSDIEKEIDLIEEVGRIYGYDRIPDAVSTKGPLFTPSNPRETFAGTLRQIMTAAGFDEMMGHGLADSRHATLIYPGLPQVKIINPIAEDLNIMRNTLMVTALTTVAHNLAHRNVDLRLFEIGAAYFPPDGKQDWHEDDRLCLAVTGGTPSDWRNHPRPSDFYDLKGALDILFWRLGFGGGVKPGAGEGEVVYQPCGLNCFDPSQSFEIRYGENRLGVAGQMPADLLRKFDIKQPVWLAELEISTLISCRQTLTSFRPLAVYPAAPRDLALIVGDAVPVGRIVAEIRAVAGEVAESVDVFDIYRGKPIPAGLKSVGITIVYRSSERSLSGDEVEQVQQKVVARLKTTFNAELREQ
jgi:phenylalanyl-tRNA synthetase beta chain